MKKLLAIITLFLVLSPLFARDITIFVLDTDIDLPLEGATIRLWNGTDIICDHDGKAVIQAPDDRQVVVQATYPGYETRRFVITQSGDTFTIGLRLSGVMHGSELVVEAARPGTNESRSGRSVAVSEREIAQTAEIGIIEDVMSTIKLLPGVSYTGTFSAFPSIRGGHPGDMIAAFDGYYVNNPYHWGGGFSIFDPRMVSSAQLSHGVFSVRYGHTISGLLEITSKKPSFTETQFELGLNTSAANMNLSLPLNGKGGILFMGRITYYDPIIELMKGLSSAVPDLEAVEYIKQAPYIRSTAVSLNYRFTDKLELTTTGFFGMDGIGVNFDNLSSSENSALDSSSTMKFDYTNFQGFITNSLFWNPRNDMLFKFTLGTGYENMLIDGDIRYIINKKKYSDSFLYEDLLKELGLDSDSYENYNNFMQVDQSDFLYNAQGRIDFDWHLHDHFIVAAGVQEMFNWNVSKGVQKISDDIWFYNMSASDQDKIRNRFPSDFDPPQGFWNYLRVEVPLEYNPNAENKLFTTSGYILGEFSTQSGRIKAETGLRVDHFHLIGKEFTATSDPALNPRVNLDFNLLKTDGILQSLDLSLGSGLFSSIDSTAFYAEERFNTTKIKPNRSWTSIVGIRTELPESLSFSIEGYYKYVYDRMYITIEQNLDDQVSVNPYFNGKGIVWGIDAMIHKVHSRFWDGWISYSYNWAKYKDPNGNIGGMGISGGIDGDDWYFPSYHRFHTLNLVMNYKPTQNMNLYVRFGLATGVPLMRRLTSNPVSYPVLVNADDEELKFIEVFRWPSALDGSNRTTISLPMDIKYSIFGSNPNKKLRFEVYVAMENVLALLYTSQGNTSFNPYTGEVDTGSNSASYEIPIPIPSFGFKISY